jgi:hypothetical protein
MVKTDVEEVGVEEICVELFKISNKLKILADLSEKVIGDPAYDFLSGTSRDLKEVTTEFLELA